MDPQKFVDILEFRGWSFTRFVGYPTSRQLRPRMKRKAETEEPSSPPTKKAHLAGAEVDFIQSSFRPDLFSTPTLRGFQDAYNSSSPYPHAVVSSLISEPLLRAVRDEIKTHVHFTLKETDIYRIHQSGDLANLSKLDAESLQQLPNLLRLRDALYSSAFLEWISTVTGAGNVSGQKTDMAVNVYTPGSYLLCHDDVIGSRRVSYILYLTDPDIPWEQEWGGGLRLYATETRRNDKDERVQVPLAQHTVNIPPAFSQMSFFAVRPGESYHDVEEVYHAAKQGNDKDDGGRIRMAISGWYHIPQEGEAGYEAGAEQAMAQKSSLAQLQGKADEFDEPQPLFRHYDESRVVMNSKATKYELDPGDAADLAEDILTEQDLTFLLHYISPSFLTPQMIDQFALSFEETSTLQLESFLSTKFADELKTSVEDADREEHTTWSVARPPHKHRYAYLQASERLHGDRQPIPRMLTDLLHSHAFKKWLSLITGFKASDLIRQNVIARRFRRGKDYALASPYIGEQPQLDFTIGMTPSTGWDREEPKEARTNGNAINGHGKHDSADVQVDTSPTREYGGEEVYMAGDDDDSASTHSNSLPSVGKKAAHDPAVYKAREEEVDSILFTNTPGWNTFSVVLRDKGTLRFVKYVSQVAEGDRWDVKGEVELGEHAFDDEEETNNSDVALGFDGPETEEEENDDEDYDSDPNYNFEDHV